MAAAIATFAVIELYNTYKRPGHFTDFSIAWLGAKALLAGHDPYEVVGQGRLYEFRWPATYPMPAYIFAMPFTLLSERVASYVFVWLSTFALAFGITTVRSPGSTPYEGVEDKEAVDAGVRIGPRVVAAGYLMEWQRVYYKMAVAIKDSGPHELALQRAQALGHEGL